MPRTTAGHAAARKALGRLGLRLGTDADRLIFIGGLSIEHLTGPQTHAHQGTTDIDALVQLGAVYDRDEDDFGWLEDALRLAGFVPRGGGSRWYASVDDVEVRIDLLSDVSDNPGQEIGLPGTRLLSSQNLDGPGAAVTDVVTRSIELEHGEAAPGGPTTVELRFVGLGGYVLAKASAVLGRTESKDLYDLAFVVLYNSDGGPAAAGRAAARALHDVDRGPRQQVVRAAMERFDGQGSVGAQAFSVQRRLDGDPTEPETLSQDAAVAARLFLRAFEAGLG